MLELDLDGSAARWARGIRVAASAESAEDAQDVVGAPGPERPAVDLDPVAVGPDAQSGGASHTPVPIETDAALPAHVLDRGRDLLAPMGRARSPASSAIATAPPVRSSRLNAALLMSLPIVSAFESTSRTSDVDAGRVFEPGPDSA